MCGKAREDGLKVDMMAERSSQVFLTAEFNSEAGKRELSMQGATPRMVCACLCTVYWIDV